MVAATDPLTTIGIVVLVGLVLSLVFKRMGQNPVIGFILSGFLLGPFGLNFLQPGNELLNAFSELGLFVLLFYLGIELSFKDFIKGGISTFSLALADMAVLFLLGFSISMLLGFSILFSAVIGVILFCTSSAIVGKFLLDRGLFREKSSQLAMAILILQDFLGILVLVFVTSFSGSSSSSAVELGAIALVFSIAMFYGVHRLSGVVEKFFQKNNFSVTELGFYCIGIGLIVAALGSFLNLSAAIGAYFAGFALSELEAGKRVKHQFDFLRDFFLLFFFAAFGVSLVPPSAQVLFLLVFVAILVLGMVVCNGIVFTVLGPLFNLTNRATSEIAILLTPLGEFVIIIAISVAPSLVKSEADFLFPIAFLLILFSLFIFQPLYKKKELHDKLTSKIPALAPRPLVEVPVAVHTPESIVLLRNLGVNLLLLVCVGWVASLLYHAIPEFGIPIPYGRLIATVIIVFFLALPLVNRSRHALRKLWHLSCKNPEHHHAQSEH